MPVKVPVVLFLLTSLMAADVPVVPGVDTLSAAITAAGEVIL